MQMLPFATESTPLNELAKFFRDLNNLPPISLEQPTALALIGSGDEQPGSDGEAILTNNATTDGDSMDEDNGGDDVDELTRQLERFETSLNDYDSLVTSLCRSEIDSNSNS